MVLFQKHGMEFFAEKFDPSTPMGRTMPKHLHRVPAGTGSRWPVSFMRDKIFNACLKKSPNQSPAAFRGKILL